MTSPTTAIRARGRRCAACNQPAAAWICETCSFSSDYYSARFYADVRSSSPTTISRHGKCPGPSSEYADVPKMQALNTQERLDLLRKRLANYQGSQEEALCCLREMSANAEKYPALSARVACNTARRRDREALELVPQEYFNHVAPLDPRRWCDECIAARVHRSDCPLTAIDGKYVGGYPSDGLRPVAKPTFTKLRPPAAHWQPVHHRQHARAVRRRWDAFCLAWTKIGLDWFAKKLRGEGAIRPARATKRKPTKRKPSIYAG